MLMVLPFNLINWLEGTLCSSTVQPHTSWPRDSVARRSLASFNFGPWIWGVPTL